MKKQIFLSVLLASALLLAFNTVSFAQKTKVVKKKTLTTKSVSKFKAIILDPAQSTVTWNGKKVTGEHSGTIGIKAASVAVSGNQLAGAKVIMDMASIACTDITDAETNGKLVGHLRSDDFFGVAKHPTATLKVTKVVPIAGAAADQPNTTISGNITIKGMTQPISFPAYVTVNGGKVTAKGAITINRTKFDIRYGSKSFFDSIGDKAIDDDFVLNFNVVSK